MSSTTETRTVVEQIVDTEQERTFWEVVRHHERPPYFFDNEGVGNRLARAARVVTDGRLTPNSDGSYTVEGSEGRTYRVAERCTCPQAQKGKSHWCYHHIAVVLYLEWQRRIRPAAPASLGTLRAGTLPLPPVTVDERLARTMEALDTMNDAAAAVRVGQGSEKAAMGPLHTPQEDAMPDDEYTLEPETYDAPGATLDASDADGPPLVQAAPSRPLPGPVLLPSLDARTLEQSMQAWSAQRQVVKRFLQQELVEGTDYYTLRIKGRETKPALSKAGSEKFMALFQLHATFEQDAATWTMLGQPQGTLCYVCTLHTRGGEIVGEGRGARTLQQDGGDINKAVKMACKSSMVDAILRTGALSDVFTQDEESIPGATPEPVKPATPARPTSQDLRSRIWAMVKGQAPDVTTREAVEAWIHQETGYVLHPDNYRTILEALEVRA